MHLLLFLLSGGTGIFIHPARRFILSPIIFPFKKIYLTWPANENEFKQDLQDIWQHDRRKRR